MQEVKSTVSPVHSKLLLLVLGLSALSACLVTVAFQVLMIDVAASFQVQVGTASMAASVGSISGITFGLLLAVVSMRYSHKLLLLGGLACTILGALGYYFAPTFPLLLASNIGVGAGIAIVSAMAYSIIGDVYPLEKRGKAVGVIVAFTTLAFVIGSPATGLLASYLDWRTVTIALTLPVALASLVSAAFVIPKRQQTKASTERKQFSPGCKQAFTSVSAVAALSVTIFLCTEGAIGYYSVSFFRDQFDLSVGWGSSFILFGSLAGAVGGAIAGLLVNRMGRKNLGTITFLLASILTLMFTFMPTVELSGSVGLLRFWFAAMASTAGGSLILEQLPKFRSTMMSLNAAFMNIGILVASVFGGLMLNSYGYQAVGLALGSLGLVGVVIWVTLVKEPCPTTTKT
ncbi:MAG: MFS transporter [Candidatus Bathyarchaeota archaeon]|nr:MFS transporter [Candidatus Bathyarchaeota archaeon]